MRWTEITEAALLESTPRTLYHGTLRKFVPSIMKYRLWPSLGDFTRAMYDIEDDAEYPELVFAADKQGMRACFSAIGWLIKKHYGQSYSVDLIRQHGAICILRHAGDRFERRSRDGEPDAWYDDHPPHVEPGDYYSRDSVKVDAVLTGNKMLGYFARYAGLRSEETATRRREAKRA